MAFVVPEVHALHLAVPAVATEPMHLKATTRIAAADIFVRTADANFAGNQWSASAPVDAHTSDRRPLRYYQESSESEDMRVTGRGSGGRPSHPSVRQPSGAATGVFL